MRTTIIPRYSRLNSAVRFTCEKSLLYTITFLKRLISEFIKRRFPHQPKKNSNQRQKRTPFDKGGLVITNKELFGILYAYLKSLPSRLYLDPQEMESPVKNSHA